MYAEHFRESASRSWPCPGVIRYARRKKRRSIHSVNGAAMKIEE